MHFTHIDQQGRASMVDVSGKEPSVRTSTATGSITMSKEAFTLLSCHQHDKGDVLAVARIAAIQGAKQCSNLIPLCHPLMLSKVQVEFSLDANHHRVEIEALCKLTGQTGVEMEALTAVSVAALTIFDMCKAVDPAMVIGPIQVVQKSGGKSGEWHNPNNESNNEE